MKLFLITISAIATISGNAQTILTPGKRSFEKKWAVNTDYQMDWYAMKDTSKVEIGKVSTRVERGKDNITVITRVSMKNVNSTWVDSTIADINTLEPVYHSSCNMQRDMVLNFGKIVTGYYSDKIKKTHTAISDTAASDYFDSNLYPVLIGWLPLKEGYRRDIAIYDYNPASKTGVIKASVTEVKSGTYQSAKSGIRDVWVVKVTDEIGNGENTYLFDKQDRKLWKHEINAGGRVMLMQLIEQ